MKVLLVNTEDRGGAARACLRLHQGLRHSGVASRLLLLRQSRPDVPESSPLGKQKSKTQRGADKLRLRLWERRNYRLLAHRAAGFDIFTFPDAPWDIIWHQAYGEADLVNLHWVADFLNYAAFFSRNAKPLVWTLHDMNPFTGGCHYAGSCEGFHSACSRCPQLEGTRNPAFSARSFAFKARALSRVPDDGLVVVALSRWLLNVSSSSALFGRFEHRLIPNGIDSSLYRLLDRRTCREMLGLPEKKKILLFVGDDLANARKGYVHFRALMELLSGRPDILACVVGRTTRAGGRLPSVLEMGSVADERLMNMFYAAADAFVITSLEDNLPNTVIESLMSGTPVAGFAVGGVQDMVKPGLNGLLAPAAMPRHLAQVVEMLLGGEGAADRETIRKDALARYDLPVQAAAYLGLYHEMLNRRESCL